MRIASIRRSAVLFVPLILFCLVTPRRAAAQGCEHEARRAGTMPMAGVERVRIEAGAGSLRVEGRAGLDDVRAQGRACASDADRLAELDIRLTRSGSTVEIEVLYPENRRSVGNRYAYLDLVVELPQGVAVRVDDGSGDIVIVGTGALDVRDGSGNLAVRDVAGSLRVDDGSGNIEIERVAGSVEIEDGSGNVEVVGAGSVDVEDGSGEIEIADVRGTVTVDDGSGNVRVRDIGGDFRVDSGGSGNVRHANVRGRVSIPDDD